MNIKEEAINSYLSWEFSKPIIRASLDVLETSLEKTINRALRIQSQFQELDLSLEEKLRVVEYFSPKSARAILFKQCSWSKREYPVSELGTVLPEVGDLPPEVIVKPLKEVVNYIKNLAPGATLATANLMNLPKSLKSPVYIQKLARITSVLELFPIIVIEPAKLQRSKEKMSKHYHIEKWNVFTGNGYIEDGNHRALALCLANELQTIPSYVGRC